MWHERIVLYRLGESRYLLLTPDQEIEDDVAASHGAVGCLDVPPDQEIGNDAAASRDACCGSYC